jgi:hypothetical protein
MQMTHIVLVCVTGALATQRMKSFFCFFFSKDLHVNTYFSFIEPTNFPVNITDGQITVKCIVDLSDFQGLGLEVTYTSRAFCQHSLDVVVYLPVQRESGLLISWKAVSSIE